MTAFLRACLLSVFCWPSFLPAASAPSAVAQHPLHSNAQKRIFARTGLRAFAILPAMECGKPPLSARGRAHVEKIKARNAAAVIIKEQSCIGRDIIEAGLLKRVFGTYHVRFIAADILDVTNRFDSVLTLRDRISGSMLPAPAGKSRRYSSRA